MAAQAYTLEEANEELRKHVQKLQKVASESDMLADRKQFVKELDWLLRQMHE